MNEKNIEKEFKYVEFIRNPQKGTDYIKRLNWMALDYFDCIQINEANSLLECMGYQNDIPCEAYQGIVIFKDIGQNKIITDEKAREIYPFIAVLQITILSEVYDGEEKSKLYQDTMKELEEIVKEAGKSFDESCQVQYSVYYTVNNVDFCILLWSDRLDLADYVSNTIRSIPAPKGSPKYTVYTTVGIQSDFGVGENTKIAVDKTYMEDDTVLVTRVLLNGKFYSRTILEDFIKNLQNRENIAITNTHSLPGRYELSIRVDGKKNILRILPFVLQFNSAWLKGQEKELDIAQLDVEDIEKEENTDSIFFLINRHCVKYLNTRVFCSGVKSLGDIKRREDITSISDKQIRILEDCNEVESLFEKLKKELSEVEDLYSKQVFQGYSEKLERIVHTYVALSSNDDIELNMNMLKEYLLLFLNLLLLNADFLKKKLIGKKDYAMNFLSGINYIQQYIKIVTSVNGNSFETPQFGTERDECSIGKLPIAYTEFLNSVFEKYYDKRTHSDRREEDKEFEYFPRYYPLVVPYMLDGKSDFMMTTLLAQNMSDYWDEIKDDWKKHIQDNKVLMFIICQDMKKYKDVSALLVTSFHELGHYSNRITRRERNLDLLRIYSDEIATAIIRRWIGSVKTGYRMMIQMELEAEIIQCLKRAVYEALVEAFQEYMKDYLDNPASVFKEKFSLAMELILNQYFNCENTEIFKDPFSDNLYYTAKFEFDLGDKVVINGFTGDVSQQNQEIIEQIKVKAKKALLELDEKLRLDVWQVETVKPKVEEIREYISAVLQIWEKLSVTYTLEIQDIQEEISKVRNGVNITGFLQTGYGVREDLPQWQIESFLHAKDILNNTHEALRFVLKLLDRTNVEVLINEIMERRIHKLGEEKISAEQLLRKSIDIKKRFLKSAHTKYHKYVGDKFNTMTTLSDQFYEFYYKMNITPDSGYISGFEKALNDILMGLFIPEMQLDLGASCYVESLADITMCANLRLTAEEYLAVVKNYYNSEYEKDSKWKIARPVIVLSFLWFIKQAKNKWEECRKEDLKKDFNKELAEMSEKLKKEKCQSIMEIIDLIREKYVGVFDSELYWITMNRVNELNPYMTFFDKEEDISFIHEDLQIKLQDQGEKTEEIQAQEINFILQYYYENRKRYSKTLQKKEDTEDGNADRRENGGNQENV